MANKRGNPRWKKGESGNPNGRPKIFAEIKEFARHFMTTEGFPGLLELLHNTPHDAVKARIYETLMAYGFGKPSQKLELSGEVKSNIGIDISKIPINDLKQIRDILKNAGTPTDTNP